MRNNGQNMDLNFLVERLSPGYEHPPNRITLLSKKRSLLNKPFNRWGINTQSRLTGGPNDVNTTEQTKLGMRWLFHALLRSFRHNNIRHQEKHENQKKENRSNPAVHSGCLDTLCAGLVDHNTADALDNRCGNGGTGHQTRQSPQHRFDHGR